MPAEQTESEDRAAARVRAFTLIQDLQAGDPAAPAELTELTARARAGGMLDIERIGLYGRAVHSWISQDGAFESRVTALIEASRRDGDDCMTALGLALQAAFMPDGLGGPASPTFDGDLAQAVVLLDNAENSATSAGRALEMISARTACGIAFDFRSLWELGDEQYAAALELAGEAEPGIGDTLLSAVMFNRAEAHVSWSGRLRQLGETEEVAARWRAWTEVAADAEIFAMPDAWYAELVMLGQLMAAIGGQDVWKEAAQQLDAVLADRPDARAVGHLKLAIALSHSNAGRAVAEAAAQDAVDAADPEAFPLLYDLALHLAAELEAGGPAGGGTGSGAAPPAGSRPRFGLMSAQRQLRRQWTDRLSRLGAMRSRISAERMRLDFDRISIEAKLDELTGIGNRRALSAFTDELDSQDVGWMALIMVDVDHFKEVNDRHGHAVGDAVLAHIARILDLGVRPSDLAVRLGGDEFMVAMAGADMDVARSRADGLMEQIRSYPWDELSPGLRVSVSMGVAGGRREEGPDLRAAADQAVYRSKRAGGAMVTTSRETSWSGR